MAPTYLSFSAAAVLQAVAQGYTHGFDVMDVTGLPSGTVYPALRRMEESGLIASQWEKPTVAQRAQRPARKYYELTKSGERALADALARYRLPEQAPARPVKPARSSK
jgi:DNA-binding PadR family transcriptional regulator